MSFTSVISIFSEDFIVIALPPLKSTPNFIPLVSSITTPIIITRLTTIILYFAYLVMFLTLLFLHFPKNKLILSSNLPVFIKNDNTNLLTPTIDIEVTIIVNISIVAKPLTLDSPNINNTKAAINVVRFASIRDTKLLLFPSTYAFFKLLPFAISSLIFSKVMILESTAIPIPSIKAAIPVKVNTPSIKL